MKIRRPRHYLEVRIGKSSLVEVVLHVRDRVWWNERDPLRTQQFLDLLQQDVLPRLLRDEVQENATLDGYSKPPKLGKGGIPLLDVGEKNLPLHPPAKGKQGKKRTRVGRDKDSNTEISCETDNPDKYKDYYYSFGGEMQLTFRLENVAVQIGATLAVGTEKDAFQHLRRLNKRIVAWCYPYDGNTREPDPPDAGPFRPEFIPLSQIFRQPKNIQEE